MKRPRKPRKLSLENGLRLELSKTGRWVYLGMYSLDLRTVKRLHVWLGRAIAWMESKK